MKKDFRRAEMPYIKINNCEGDISQQQSGVFNDMLNDRYATYFCDSFDNSIIGKYVKSDKSVSIYDEMGGPVVRTALPNHIIGKVTAVNTKGNWLYVNDPYNLKDKPRFVFKSDDLKFVDGGAPLTDKQKTEIVVGAISAAAGAGNPIAGAAVDTGKVVVETTANIATSLFGGLKWLIVGVVLVVLIALYIKLK